MKNNIFEFESDNLKDYIQYDLKLFSNMKQPLDFIFGKMKELGYYKKLTSLENVELKCPQHKGKNYNWSVIEYENVKLLIREYNKHLTIYVKVSHERNIKDHKYTNYDYGAFTFYTNPNKVENDRDKMLDEIFENPFVNLNPIAKNMFEELQRKNGTHWMSNSAAFKIPKFCEAKVAFSNSSIHSYDKLVFVFEELEMFGRQLFAETEMLKRLKECDIKKGDIFDDDEVIEVITEFSKEYSDPYYHGVGIKVKNGDRERIKDVYFLTRWHLDEMFPEKD